MAEQNSMPVQGAAASIPTPTPMPTTPAPPIPPVQPAPQPTTPVQPQTVIIQKSSPWPWIVGGCLTLVILIIAFVVFAGWWGAKKIKNEMEKYEPTVKNVKNNIDKMNKEVQEWEKKSQELQESMPNPEDFSTELKKIK